MASEMPVLPDVGSSTVQPGLSCPSASARSTIASAGRSLIDPVGVAVLQLRPQPHLGEGDSDGKPTIGVSPTAARRESYRAISRRLPRAGS
jgi:hypothetical protein